MRFAAVLFFAFAFSGAFASEPGQPLDCSDWVLPPGYSCSYFFNGLGGGDWTYGRGTDLAVDNLGGLLRIDSATGVYINRLDPTTGDGTFGYVLNRSNGSGGTDGVRPRCGGPSDCALGRTNTLVFDSVNGRLIFAVNSYGDGYSFSSTLVISGFPSFFDINQSYQPQPAQLSFRVPYMPEGLPAAEHFDTYWGSLAHPIDFAQAHPMQCNYPAAAPHVGDYLTVTDTVPTPGPGQGVYYVTAATYQGATRYGRKTTAGHLSGRDPAALPGCAIELTAVNP